MVPVAGAAASDPAAGPAQKGDAPAADDAKSEAYWHTRMASARENLRRTQVIYDALQARLGGSTADYNQSDLFERNKYWMPARTRPRNRIASRKSSSS